MEEFTVARMKEISNASKSLTQKPYGEKATGES
jgi:hypothetical protein